MGLHGHRIGMDEVLGVCKTAGRDGPTGRFYGLGRVYPR